MYYYILCKNCREKNYLIVKERRYENRRLLEREIGERFSLDCGYCGESKIYHISEVVAAKSKYTILKSLGYCFLGFLSGTLFTSFLKIANAIGDYFAFFLTILGITIGFVIFICEEKREDEIVKNFNIQ